MVPVGVKDIKMFRKKKKTSFSNIYEFLMAHKVSMRRLMRYVSKYKQLKYETKMSVQTERFCWWGVRENSEFDLTRYTQSLAC
jgi:hypothetical protein